MRAVRHGQHIRHMSFRRRVDDGDVDLVVDDVQHLGDEDAAVEYDRFAGLQVNIDVVMPLLETGDGLAEQVDIVVAAGDVMPAPEVDPLHVRNMTCEPFLETFQYPHEYIGALLAECMEMKTGDTCHVGTVKVSWVDAET